MVLVSGGQLIPEFVKAVDAALANSTGNGGRGRKGLIGDVHNRELGEAVLILVDKLGDLPFSFGKAGQGFRGERKKHKGTLLAQ
jgi:hypothetical protein